MWTSGAQRPGRLSRFHGSGSIPSPGRSEGVSRAQVAGSDGWPSFGFQDESAGVLGSNPPLPGNAGLVMIRRAGFVARWSAFVQMVWGVAPRRISHRSGSGRSIQVPRHLPGVVHHPTMSSWTYRRMPVRSTRYPMIRLDRPVIVGPVPPSRESSVWVPIRSRPGGGDIPLAVDDLPSRPPDPRSTRLTAE